MLVDTLETSVNPLGIKQAKGSEIVDQFKTVFIEFHKEPQTMKQVSVKTGIDRANICWYCREMRKNNCIVSIKKIYCPITKHRANVWTTNSSLFPINKQLTLF